MAKKPRKPKKLIGRPPIGPELVRNIELRVRMNQGEAEKYRAAADSVGLPVGAWVREVLLRAATVAIGR